MGFSKRSHGKDIHCLKWKERDGEKVSAVEGNRKLRPEKGNYVCTVLWMGGGFAVEQRTTKKLEYFDFGDENAVH